MTRVVSALDVDQALGYLTAQADACTCDGYRGPAFSDAEGNYVKPDQCDTCLAVGILRRAPRFDAAEIPW